MINHITSEKINRGSVPTQAEKDRLHLYNPVAK